MKRIAQTRQLALSELSFYPANPRRGDVAAIRESLQATGQYRAIVVRSDTREVLAGNHTLAAMRELGYEKALCHLVDVDDEQARRIVLADNRTAELASYDEQALAALLAEMDGDLEGTGWDQRAVDELSASLTDPGEDTEPIEPPAKPRTKLGDMYLLGEHRLLCGDATVAESYDRLLDGALAQMVFTDPPYGISYRDTGAGAWNERKLALKQAGLLRPRFEPIDGDELRGDELLSFLLDAFAAMAGVSAPEAAWYVWHAVQTQGIFEAALDSVGYQIRNQVVWAKSRAAFNFAQYKYQHEPCFYAFRRGKVPVWLGDRAQSTLWEVASESGATYEHPTQKPIALAVRATTNSSPPGGIVLDSFAGSGSTLIACENLKRRCYAMEIDPGYCDVIVDRWERHTGHTAALAT